MVVRRIFSRRGRRAGSLAQKVWRTAECTQVQVMTTKKALKVWARRGARADLAEQVLG